MQTDVVIVGAGPAGIFTAIEMIRKGSKQKIVIVEKGQPIEPKKQLSILPTYMPPATQVRSFVLP